MSGSDEEEKEEGTLLSCDENESDDAEEDREVDDDDKLDDEDSGFSEVASEERDEDELDDEGYGGRGLGGLGILGSTTVSRTRTGLVCVSAKQIDDERRKQMPRTRESRKDIEISLVYQKNKKESKNKKAPEFL